MTSSNYNASSKNFTTAAETKHDVSGDKNFGLVNKRYIKTFHGIIHGICSTKALLLGNVVFVNRVLLGNPGTEMGKVELIFHRANFVSAATTALFFWNQVQAWQLSTTTMEEKGISPRGMQKANQGRGVVAMLLFSLLPLVCQYMTQHALDSRVFAKGLALTLMAGSAFVYHLLKDYGKPALWLVYGMTPMALGMSILCCSDHRGSVASVTENYPAVMDQFQKEASFVISCVQMGFFQYYLYSRNLVTKRTVQKICKTYHVTLSMIFLYRVERDLWLRFTTGTVGVIPWPMMVQPMILTLAMNVLLVPLVLKKVLAMGAKTVTEQQSMKSSLPVKRIQSPQHQQTHEAKNSTAFAKRRRSSATTRIESVCR